MRYWLWAGGPFYEEEGGGRRARGQGGGTFVPRPLAGPILSPTTFLPWRIVQSSNIFISSTTNRTPRKNCKNASSVRSISTISLPTARPPASSVRCPDALNKRQAVLGHLAESTVTQPLPARPAVCRRTVIVAARSQGQALRLVDGVEEQGSTKEQRSGMICWRNWGSVSSRGPTRAVLKR